MVVGEGFGCHGWVGLVVCVGVGFFVVVVYDVCYPKNSAACVRYLYVRSLVCRYYFNSSKISI